MILTLDPFFAEASQDSFLKVQLYKRIDQIAVNDCESVEGIVVRLGNNLTSGFLSRFSNLKWVATITTGTDHIDTEYLMNKGILLLSLKGETGFLESIHATPEHTWALLLALMRRLPQSHASVCKGEWNRSNFEGHELYQKTLGIVGMGRVGKIVARYAEAFGMNVIFTDSKTAGDTLETVLRVADIVTLHPDLNASSYHLMGLKEFELMKSSAVLINTSRGAVLDEVALLEALKTKKIAGAALDVLEAETIDGVTTENKLVLYAREHSNLILTPHIAGSTIESLRKTAKFMVAKVEKALGSSPDTH